jgi:hypothetical protein
VILDGIGTSTLAYCLLARTVVSHIRCTARLDLEPVTERISHLAALEYPAPRDPGSFGPGWREEWRERVLGTPDEEPYPIP